MSFFRPQFFGFQKRSAALVEDGGGGGDLIFPATRFVDLDPALVSGADGDSISTAPDGSGNGRNGTGESGFLPTLQAINGVKTYRFNNGKRFNLGNYSSLTEATIFLVIKLDDGTPNSETTTGLWDIGNGGNTHFPFTNGLVYDTAAAAARREAIDISGQDLSQWTVYAIRAEADNFRTVINASHIRDDFGVVSFPTNGILGASASTSVYQLFGNVARFIVFEEAMTNGEITGFSTELMNYYGDLF